MIKEHFKHSTFLLVLFTAFWVVFALFFGLKQCSKKSSDLPKIVKRGVIRVCGEEDLFSFYKDKKGFHGFHYELAKAFSDKYNLDLEYTSEIDFNKRVEMLVSGKCDIITGPLPVIAELRSAIAYTKPILKSYVVLVQRKEEGKKPIRDQILLAGKSIAVTENSPNIPRIHNLANEISDSIHIREFIGHKNKDLIEAVSKGLLDFAACDRNVAQAYLTKYPNIDIKTNLGLLQFQAWAVRPEKNALFDSLNNFISEYKRSPAFTRLLEKYSK
jgi:membrane-bound lytic murein transglycosylase F